MANQKIHLGHETRRNVSEHSKYKSSSASYWIDKPEIVGRIDTFPNQRPPVSKVYVANTSDVVIHQHANRHEALIIDQPERANIIGSALIELGILRKS